MPIEVITMLAGVATILVALVSGFGWMVNRMDSRFAEAETRTDARFAQVDARFAQVDAKFDKLEDRIGELAHEVSEVKIAIARLEGPTPRLITGR